MNWIKKGSIFNVDGRHEWNKSHAQVPVVDILNDNVWRIYYATRNDRNISTISFIDVEAGNPSNVLGVHDKPILDLGNPGAFDDSGLMPAWILNYENKKYLYYIGWTLKNKVPYQNSIGLAISEDGGVTFNKISSGPVIGQSMADPYFTGTICVSLKDGCFRSWYLSCTKWEEINSKMEPFYNIKYAESNDGIHWKTEGVVAVDLNGDEEGGLASASVIECRGLYKMWYSYRGFNNFRTDIQNSYKIGYAESIDGIHWNRLDHLAGIDVSIIPSDWDSEMIEYPCVIEYKGKKYMFYNGNGFGKTGIGYAILSHEE